MTYAKTLSAYYFFATHIDRQNIMLHEDEFHHIYKVLRVKEQTRIYLTDGKGQLAGATIAQIDKKGVTFNEIDVKQLPALPYNLHIAIAPTKNINRFEWFLEKATEIGVSTITPLFTENSERKHLRTGRLEKILRSATTQSKKVWKPTLLDLQHFSDFIVSAEQSGRYIAYTAENTVHLKTVIASQPAHTLLIGPEGGFSQKEHQQAVKSGYHSVSLGQHRLRTETAGIVGAQIFAMHYD